MEIQENKEISQEDMWRKIEKSQRRGKIMGGLLIISIGSLFLARELGAQIPAWLFSWKMLLIGLGIVAAIKHKFMNPAWIVLVGVGGAFLLTDIYPDLHIGPFIWPVLIILLGIAILFKPRRKEMHYAKHYWKSWHQAHHKRWNKDHHPEHRWNAYNECGRTEAIPTDEDYIDSTNILGGVKKNILSKKFKGGEVVNVFGGAHINLTQADFEGTATLNVTQVFGGSKLIIPANWEIRQSETVTVCGGIEDKRPVQPNHTGESQKVLILVGTTVFGGIEINSF